MYLCDLHRVELQVGYTVSMTRSDLFVRRIRFLPALFLVVVGCMLPLSVHAQTASTTPQTYVARAVVLKVVSNILTSVPDTSPETYAEIVQARVVTGAEHGKLIEFEDDYTQGDSQKVSQGDEIYVERWTNDSEPNVTTYQYSSIDHDRLPIVILFITLFLGCIVFLGGKQGIRGLVALGGGMCLIVFVLLPGILHGYSPVLLSILVASLIASVGAYITHGFSKMTSSAVVGMIVTIVIAALLSEIAVHFGYLSGITDENTYNMLQSPYGGVFDFQGLLLGGIIIGLLGVLYDAAIGQAVAVEELTRAGPHLPRGVIYARAFRIGREHIGALVNTLILAYVGVSLPIMLTFYESGFGGWTPPLNWEFIATEIIRTSVGAIGLMLTIPITTAAAVWVLVKERGEGDVGTTTNEHEVIQKIGHRH